jgi:hypothetical protein
MGRALALREDFTAADPKRLARASRDVRPAGFWRWLWSVTGRAGPRRRRPAGSGGVGRQIVR